MRKGFWHLSFAKQKNDNKLTLQSYQKNCKNVDISLNFNTLFSDFVLIIILIHMFKKALQTLNSDILAKKNLPTPSQ